MLASVLIFNVSREDRFSPSCEADPRFNLQIYQKLATPCWDGDVFKNVSSVKIFL
jgi:hypothetical protein